MTTQDLIEKLKRYPVASICAAVVVICFFATYLRLDLLTNLEIENSEISRQADQVDLNIRNGATLKEDLEAIKARAAELDARLIKHADLATNLKYFYEIEAATGVSIADLRQLPVQPVKGAAKSILTGIDYSVMINGRFSQAIIYAHELENGRHFSRMESFSIQRGREADKGVVTMSLNLKLLGWP